MTPDDASLYDVLLAINEALEFSQGMDAAAFHADKKARWAVYSQILIIGEAANRISREFQASHPAIPWAEIIGMRHKLIHGYDEIRWNKVWDTVENDLPKLKAAIEPLIPKEPET